MRWQHKARSALPCVQRLDVQECCATAKRKAVLPLARAAAYVRCAGTTIHGVWCSVSSRSLHDGADPLREGGIFCAKHALPPAEHCACCGETELELWPDEEAEARYFKQFHYFERQHYCNTCWNEWMERVMPAEPTDPQSHDASAQIEW